MFKKEEFDKYMKDSEDYYDSREPMTERKLYQLWKDGAEFGYNKANEWHKIFEGDPYSYEYWDLPQDNLPKTENFYFVRLKNGFIKVCELKYDSRSKTKSFYDLHGYKQSNVAEWLSYPTCDDRSIK